MAAMELWASVLTVSKILTAIDAKRDSSRLENRVKYENSFLDIKKSKEQNILNFTSLFEHSEVKSIAKEIIEDLYKFDFENTPSFSSKMAQNDSVFDSSARENISLKEHSFGTLNQMRRFIGKKFGIHSDFFFIIAIVHDYGKSLKLKTDKKISLSYSHHTASAAYLKMIIISRQNLSNNLKVFFNKVCTVLEAHHTPELANRFFAVEKNENNMEMEILLLDNLKKADYAQCEIDTEKGILVDL